MPPLGKKNKKGLKLIFFDGGGQILSSWFSFVIGDILLGDYFLWYKHVVFQTSCCALHFKAVPAAMNKLTLHMPAKEEGSQK